jgi:hypothetical protein
MVIKTKKKDVSRGNYINKKIKNNKTNSKKTVKLQNNKKEKPYKINVYAKNMRYIYNNETNPKNKNGNPIDINKDKYKILLSKLAEALGENQWLKYSKDKYKPIQHIDKNKINSKKYIGWKPFGSYYSKGSWLFHEDMCCNLDWEIIFIEVDYKTISRITGKEPYKSPLTNKVYKNNVLEFMTKYGVNYGNDKCIQLIECWDYDTEKECNQTNSMCQWDTTIYHKYTKKKGYCIEDKNKIDYCSKIKIENKCKFNNTSNCFFNHKYKIINWGKLYKNYNGFAIYPYPEIKLITDKKTREYYNIFMDYDVETLVLWDHSPVIKYHNLGTIRDIIEETGVKLKKNNNNTHIENYYKEFIETLIKKINDINKK